MQLLFVGTNRGGGGTESHLVSMATAMAAAGHDVSAVVWPDDVVHQALAQDGRVRLFPGRFVGRNDLRATRAVMHVARGLRPDWIIGTFKNEYWPLAIASRLLGVPAVLFSHLDQRMHPTMIAGVPRLVRAIIAPSAYQRERLIARGMPAGRLCVLHNPVDTTHFRVDPAARDAWRARLGFAPDDVVLGFVGRQERGKGVTVLADAVARAMDADPRLRMLWVGHPGDESTDLRERVAASPHAARHVWEPWAADVFPFYAAMDLLALPSIGPETFGRVLTEAQACGVPVLGSRNGGIPETMEDGVTGVLLPPGDVAAWAEALLALAGDPARRAGMSAAGREFVVRHFASEAIAARFTEMLAALGRR